MLKANHGMAAKLTGLLLAGGLVIGGLAIAGPAAADARKTQTMEVRTVIIEHDGQQPINFKIDSDHPEKMAADCPGIVTTVESGAASGPGKKEQARMLFCSKGKSNTDAASGLERAIVDIDKNDDINVEVKADLKAKLTAKIAELRAGN